jgi:L-malate glycosyltransferase
MARVSVLHITPHLGGGVGRVVLSYLAKTKTDSALAHRVCCLDYANEEAQLASRSSGFFLVDKMATNLKSLLMAISQADIVLVHWWNHPLLYALLVRESLPPARIIFWSHISGLHAPCVFNEQSLNYPDLFVFTSPLSQESPEVKLLSKERKEALRFIWSTGGIDHVLPLLPKPHSRYTVGYIGTVDYSKMHPHFLQMSSMIKVQDVQFVICGGPSEHQIQEESKQYDGSDRFLFTGPIRDLRTYLSGFDVLGYPLAPYHYGTCEQALGESMAAGVPPVVLGNRTERYIVDDGVTGIVAEDEEAYVRAIEGLYRNPDLRQRLSDKARESAKQRYSLDLMANRWEGIFKEALSFPKTERQWKGKYRGSTTSPANLFLESLGPYGNDFQCYLNAHREQDKDAAMNGIRNLYKSSPLWKSSTRGTAYHYRYFFPEDDILKLWCDLAHGSEIKEGRKVINEQL